MYLSTVPMSRVFQLPHCKVSYALNLKVAETGTPTAQTLVRGHTGKDTKLDRDRAHIKKGHSGSTPCITVSAKMSQKSKLVSIVHHTISQDAVGHFCPSLLPSLRDFYCDTLHG